MLYFHYMLGRILVGVIGAGLGFLMVWKSNAFAETFGSISDWADAHLGGTRMVYKWIGVLAIFISFLVITNLHFLFFRAVFGSLFGIPDDAVL